MVQPMSQALRMMVSQFAPSGVPALVGGIVRGANGPVYESSGLADGIEDDIRVSTIWDPRLPCFPVLILRKSVT